MKPKYTIISLVNLAFRESSDLICCRTHVFIFLTVNDIDIHRTLLQIEATPLEKVDKGGKRMFDWSSVFSNPLLTNSEDLAKPISKPPIITVSAAKSMESAGVRKINYGKLDVLLNISGLEDRYNLYTTEEAHKKFMAIYPTIFVNEKAMLPCLPDKRKIVVHSCYVRNNYITSEDFDSHNVKFYMNQVKGPQRLHSGSPEFIGKLQGVIKILKKIPNLRTQEEHETVYKTMKMISGISDQLSDEELRELSTIVITEYWVKGSKVVGNKGFYAVLKGSVRPQTKYYKKMVGGDFVSATASVGSSSSTIQASKLSWSLPPQPLLGVGCCFGTLEPLHSKLQHGNLTITTEDDCDFLKISSAEYLRVKEEIAKREQLAKEELIRGSPYYQDWPMVFIFQLTAKLKWKKFPTNHVFIKGGEISQYIGFIKSGHCNAYRIIPALVKRPLGKMIKQMRQVLIGQLKPKESFGEMSLLLQIPFAYMVKAATPVELGIIEASDILSLDPVIHMLLLQTVKPSFENITHDDLKLAYIKKETEKEWKHKKDMILKETLFYNGINPGFGKWVHEKPNLDKRQKKHQEPHGVVGRSMQNTETQ
ncbi:cyclic nucleotide-binding domain-containing protein 1 [Sceloporus undulatus]|uniref:cyclic nucleotide-binding domain-containing protein 1 n=1 Tax=Sceloporus undulatus TaxID=8520 RepID=UPI001C4D05CA|nr:cyclic nucleotide-binding domain-containing protein 1 [Sceloporus undulatus]